MTIAKPDSDGRFGGLKGLRERCASLKGGGVLSGGNKVISASDER
jgi:hypothetical protein